MYDLIVGIVESFIKHGMSLSALGMALFVLLKQRKVKRLLRKRLPWLLRDDADVVNYEARQIRIEAKIDALMSAGGVSWVAEKTDSSQSTAKNSWTSSCKEKSFVRTVGVFIQKGSIIISRGNQTMKTYLKKLGSRKFQAFLAVTIPNMIIMFGFILGDIDLEGQVNQWMPAINLIIQAITTATYQRAEGNYDVAKIKAEVNNDTYATREDSEGV